MDIIRSADQSSRPGPADWFTGDVTITAPFDGGGALSGSTVSFAAGARTHWHTHPRGQTLLVVSGLGRVQRDRGPVEEIHPGDIVWFAPGERHWHGAAPHSAMVHIAIAEKENGEVVTWQDAVADVDYLSLP